MNLSPQQQHAVDKVVHSRGGIVWWKVGEGKTRIAIAAFAQLQKVYQWALPSVCLVVCRRRAFRDWRDEINLCDPLASVYEDTVPVHPPGGPCYLLLSSGEIAKKVASLQLASIRVVILDESWMFANHKSERSCAAQRLTKGRIAIALSGTVMKAQDTAEIYSQAMAVGKHRYLASSPTQFRSKYQICKPMVIGGRQIPQFYPQPGSYQRIMNALTDCCDVHFPKGTRRVHEQWHNITPTSKQQRYFNELRELYSVEDFNLELDNALAVVTKTQQIANGWLADKDGTIYHFDSPKAQKLEDELSDLSAAGEKCVVWCAFRHDVTMLAARLPFATMQMVGGEDFDVDRWRNGDVHVCLATEASGSSVNHFDQTAYAIYFSANFKWLDMQQSRGRTDRRSSRHSDSFYKYLQVVGSLDHHVYSTALASGSREQMLIFQAGVRDWLHR